MITYIKGDVLQESSVKRIIIHVCSNAGGFGKGFALAVAKRYPEVRKQYRNWYQNYRPFAGFSGGGNGIQCDKESIFKLGNNQTVKINDNLIFINMLCQNGYKSKTNPIPINYNALSTCLFKVRYDTMTYDGEIWLPRIGSGLAGGDWNHIKKMIELILKDRIVKIFEL